MQLDAVAQVLRCARTISRARAAHHAEDLVALVEQQLGEVRAVLSGDAGDERAARRHATTVATGPVVGAMLKPCAVVVGWRAGERATHAIDLLRANQPGCEIVFVDNEAPSSSPRADVLPLAENRGYAGGANVGVDHAFADATITHVVVLNDDLELAPGALRLLAELSGGDGCASPTIEAPGDDAFAGGRLDAAGSDGTKRVPATS